MSNVWHTKARAIEITPLVQPKPIDIDRLMHPPNTEDLDEEMCEWGPRVIISEISGLPIVARRPGQRIVTSEEIYEELRGSGP